jgi:multiple sugar transport system ATP-binding protein
VGEGFNIEAPGAIAKTLRQYNNKEVMLGIRPEDIHDEPIMQDTFPTSMVTGQVVVVEQLGAETVLYLTIGNKEVVARIPTRNIYAVGDRVEMTVNLPNMHVFDPVTELRIE